MLLEGSVDLPAQGARVNPGKVIVEGWAAYARKPVLRVFVQSSDQHVFAASSETRTDVADHFGVPVSHKYGFRAEVDLGHLVGQVEHSVTLVAVAVVDNDHDDILSPVLKPLGSVDLVIDGSRRAIVPEPAYGDQTLLEEAYAHADMGLPLPKGVKLRRTKGIVARMGRPFLHRQVAYNKAVAAELATQISRARDDRVRIYAQLENMSRKLESLVGELRSDLDQHLEEVDDLLSQQEMKHRHQVDLVQRQAFQRHHEDLGGLRSELAEMSIELDGVRNRVDLGGGPAAAGNGNLSESSEFLKSTYAAFEDEFRGPFRLIKERAREYLSDVLALERTGPVLDMGCGRGEWLEVLKEAGVEAYGVDLDEEFVLRCVDRGLDARRADVFRHLSDIPEGSLAAVTAFHLAEHLPTNMVVELLDLSMRALHPGGLLIFETPNPENLVVGSSTFYIDPGHIRPLNPTFLSFLVGARGFVDVELRFKHPDPAIRPPNDDAPWAEDLAPVLEAVNARLFGARDYAVVGWRK
jgi:SAM-dependent methyltransferase